MFLIAKISSLELSIHRTFISALPIVYKCVIASFKSLLNWGVMIYIEFLIFNSSADDAIKFSILIGSCQIGASESVSNTSENPLSGVANSFPIVLLLLSYQIVRQFCPCINRLLQIVSADSITASVALRLLS